VYVTHDQKEALSMADRVAIMDAGRVVQVGGPRELYRQPRSRFVAAFLGEADFLEARVTGLGDGGLQLETPAGRLAAAAGDNPPTAGASVTVCVRPESWRFGQGYLGHPALEATVAEAVYLGEITQYTLALPGGQSIRASVLNPGMASGPASGDRVSVSAAPEDVIVLPHE
jgi:iron(III) transport system ATP-binding protein